MRFFLSSLSMNNSARKLCHKSISQIVDQLYWQSSRKVLSTGWKALRWYDIFKDEKNYSARRISSKEKPGCLSPQSPHPSSFPSMNQNNKARRWWSHAIHGRCLPLFGIFPFFGRIVLTLIRDPFISNRNLFTAWSTPCLYIDLWESPGVISSRYTSHLRIWRTCSVTLSVVTISS